MKEILNEWREFLSEKYPGRAKTPGEKLVSRVKDFDGASLIALTKRARKAMRALNLNLRTQVNPHRQELQIEKAFPPNLLNLDLLK
jgi:hypothetical protein